MNINGKSLREYVFGAAGYAGIEILEMSNQSAFELSGRKASREDFETVIQSYLKAEDLIADPDVENYDELVEEFYESMDSLYDELDDAALVDKLYAEYAERYAYWEAELADA
jgi:collagenase-like PrtC family protease